MADPRLPVHLIDEIVAGDCVAFVGAGFTAPVVPDWRQLLSDLANATDRAIAEGVEPLIASGSNRDLGAAAQTLRDELGDDRFFSAMQERLVDPPLNDQMNHRLALLHGIPFRAILTTNFDEVLSGQTPNREAYLEVLRPRGHRWWDPCFWDEDRPGATVVKLHGSMETPSEVVFTHRDYRRLYASPAYSTFLRSVMTSTTVLYLGFSFSDAYLNELRSEVLALLDHRGGDVPVAYAIVNDPSPAEIRYSQEHEGIQVLPVDTVGGTDYAGFDRYLEAIHDRTNPRRILSRLLAARRVAWVGDEDVGLRFLSDALGDAGPGSTLDVVETADDPGEIEAADLVIVHAGSDWPGALDLTAGIRALRVVLDSQSDTDRRGAAFGAGAVGYATDWGELLQEINRILGTARE